MGDYFTDFSLRCGSWTGSFLNLSKAIFTYILFPLALLALIDGVAEGLAASLADGINFSPILSEFALYIDRYMLYSIPLVIFSIFVGYYPAGNYARIPFKFISSAYLAIVLLMFTNGGMMSITLDGNALGMPEVAGIDMTLDVVGVIYILAIISFVKGFLAFTEFSDNRKQYLESLAEKFDDKDERNSSKKRKEKKKRDDDLDYDDPPKKKRRDYDEDDEPRRRRRDDYDDDDYEPRRKRRGHDDD